MKNPLDKSDLDYVKNRYKKRIEEYGVTFDSLRSGTIDKQELRHRVHMDSIITPNPTLLDIGCGMGDFYLYLKNKFPFKYKGIDIIPQYIEYCKNNYPDCEFELLNVFDDGLNESFDNIVLSQVLNNRYKNSDNMQVLERMIEICFTKTNVCLSIDLMSSYVDYENEELYYYSPEKVFALGKKFTRRVNLRHDYRPFEFCIQIFNEKATAFF